MRPILHAIILDCSSVNHIDVTSVQGLLDTRNVLNIHTYPEAAEWHFANLNNRWTRRALTAAGFGYPSTEQLDVSAHWNPIFSVAEIEAANGNCRAEECRDEETSDASDTICAVRAEGIATRQKTAAIHGTNRPFFYIDVAAAVESAVANATNSVANLP